MTTKLIFSLVALLLAWPVFAETIPQEVHIYPDGSIRLVNAELFREHAVNLFTVKAWGYKWLVPIDPNKTIRLESAYGTEIQLTELEEGHLLEIKGRQESVNVLDHQIIPALIRDFSIKTGEPPFPSVAPSEGGDTTATLKATQDTAQSVTTQKGALTMTLKRGYWGGQIKILQEFLKKQGYFPKSEPTSSYFGPATKKALMEFQKANALEAVGTLGPKTRALINSLLNN